MNGSISAEAQFHRQLGQEHWSLDISWRGDEQEKAGYGCVKMSFSAFAASIYDQIPAEKKNKGY